MLHPTHLKQKQEALNARLNYMENGAKFASQNQPLHIKSCILYWAEGSKNKNQFQFTNSEPATHKLMLDFIKTYFPEDFNRVKFYINFYPDQTNNYNSVQNFWCSQLNIKTEQFNKPTDRSKYYSKPKINKYPNGILRTQIGSTKILYHIYGAINYYANEKIFAADF